MLLTYWAIDRHIVEYEQAENDKAEYGSKTLETLSKDLSHELGRGFNRSNLIYMRLCFLAYPKIENLSHELTWAHFVELIKIDHDLERSFYEKQAILERWTVRELKRQKSSTLFLRLAASQDKAGVLQLPTQGRIVERPAALASFDQAQFSGVPHRPTLDSICFLSRHRPFHLRSQPVQRQGRCPGELVGAIASAGFSGGQVFQGL